MKKRFHIKMLWAASFSLYALDANAWGLYTHIYFSQHLLLCVPPLLDDRIRQAMQQFPRLVLAGACLPDLAVISKSFSASHQWHISERMLENAESEQELAIAIGYASHLFVDVIAHNHFVPAHEAKWLNRTIVTHVVSEWAMDGHISRHIAHPPHKLINMHLEELTKFTTKAFSVKATDARKQLCRLSKLDRLLRFSRISHSLLWLIKLRDMELIKNLGYYLNKTEHALSHFHFTLNGQRPHWEPELSNLSATELSTWRTQCLGDLRIRVSTPIDHYFSRSPARELV